MFYLRSWLVTYYRISLYNLLTLIVKTVPAISEEQRPQKTTDAALPGFHWRNKFVLWPTFKSILSMSCMTSFFLVSISCSELNTRTLWALKWIINQYLETFWMKISETEHRQMNPEAHVLKKKSELKNFWIKNGFEIIELISPDL